MCDHTQTARPWLSVIIPLYNAERFLLPCLSSIAAQSYADFEVLLIDDGSVDGSPAICQEQSRKDPRFRYIRKENGGAYQSRIFGAERASGTYVTFCDADDFYVTRDAFSRLHEETVRSNCRTIQFGYTEKYKHLSRKCVAVDRPVDMDRDCFLAQEYPKLLCSFWKGSHITTNVWNKIYHRSLLSALPPSTSAERVFWGDDLVLNLHLLSNCGSFRIIPDTLYGYRQSSGGTNRFSPHTMRDLDTIKKYQLKFLEEYPGDRTDRIRRTLFGETASWFFGYVRQALKELPEEEVVALIQETLQYPRFILAREYFLNDLEDKRDAAELLRGGDAHAYIRKARAYRQDRGAKSAIKHFLRKIYVSI